MKITKHVVEFLLTINGREEQGSFDGHVFTLKGVSGDQLTRLGAAIEREFGELGARFEIGLRSGTDVGAKFDRMVEKAVEVATPGAESAAAQARAKLDAQHHAPKFTREEVGVSAEQEAADRKAADETNFRREREAAASELAEEQQRRDEQAAAQKAREEAAAREVADGKARTAKLIAEQAERDRAEARAKEKADLDANLENAAAEDVARKQREEAEKPAAKPALHVVPPPPSEPKAGLAAPAAKPVPPPPAELRVPTARLGVLVPAAYALGFVTLDDLCFVLFTAWKDDVPFLRAMAGTEAEKRERVKNICTAKRLALGDSAAIDSEDE